MLTQRDIDMLIYIQSKGYIVKYGADPHPYDLGELDDLAKRHLLIKSDYTMPAPKGDYPDIGNAYTLTQRGNQIVEDWRKEQSQEQANKILAQKTYFTAKLSIVISVLSLISTLILSILSLILQ